MRTWSLACIFLFSALSLGQGASASNVVVLQKGTVVTLANSQIRLIYNLANGTFSLKRPNGSMPLLNAHSTWGDWSSQGPGLTRKWSQTTTRDELGTGKRLRVVASKLGQPSLIFDATLYRDSGYVVLGTGVVNATSQDCRIMSFEPLSQGVIKPQGPMTQVKTLDGVSGANQSQVLAGPFRTSNNNLLLTYREGDTRRSIVGGGLTYHEFCKIVSVTPVPLTERKDQLARHGNLAGYIDCGEQSRGGVLTTLNGTPYRFISDSVDPWFSSIVFDLKQVVFEAKHLNPKKVYTLGLSWWDHNNDGRVESIWVEPGDGSPKIKLVDGERLPAWEGKHQLPTTKTITLPQEAYRNGRCKILITNDAPVPNAVVSEVWLYEGNIKPTTKPIPPKKGMYLTLKSTDPVGRLVSPGETWIPDDRFYFDVTIGDPFKALEGYGQALKTAQKCNPNPYDFPTVCAWYAGVWNTPGAQNNPGKSKYLIATTPGLVEEAEKMRDSGFLQYSRAACRLVPDNYTSNNPQGWWDDAHWQREGFYVAPYETSQKWGKAMRDRGVLAITYFQPSWGTSPALSQDFRETHRELLLNNDVTRTLDYSKPETQTYMKKVYRAMNGAINGMMFDYCDNLWATEASRGGFADPKMTSTAFYRQFLNLAKQGLGKDSWIHERALDLPGHDIALGISDSQRTSGDTDKIDPAMVSKSGLRWYKNRVVIAYDMDSKELNNSWKVPGYTGTNEDGRRMMLTMAYVAASRLLLANSFRDLSPQVLSDLERTFPYPKTGKSGRPIDAFTSEGWPQIYEYDVSPSWRQVTLYNNLVPSREQTFSVPMSTENVDGGLALDPKKSYHVFDFWNDRYVGLVKGSGRLNQTLRPGEARMLSIRAVESIPQVISTTRHLMQGTLDLNEQPRWDVKTMSLKGTSEKMVRGIWIALNGYQVVGGRGYKIVSSDKSNNVLVEITGDPITDHHWSIKFRKDTR